MLIDILSLFPEYFQGPFDVSIIKRARENKLMTIRQVNIRTFSDDKHQKVDDRPFGGGPGMVLSAKPVVSAIRSVRTKNAKVIYLSPQGRKLDSEKSQELALEEHLILLCGHYEGIDERALEKEVDEEISIGDYVLTNGCIAAVVLIDVVSRFIPGVLGHPLAAMKDSFMEGYFDAPHYTRPKEFEGSLVPNVLMTGHHEKIEKWRKKKGLEKTRRVRPDLYEQYEKTNFSEEGEIS